MYENRETVEGVIDRANVLAEKHKLAALRPLLATPVVLELRDEEMALKRKVKGVPFILLLAPSLMPSGVPIERG